MPEKNIVVALTSRAASSHDEEGWGWGEGGGGGYRMTHTTNMKQRGHDWLSQNWSHRRLIE